MAIPSDFAGLRLWLEADVGLWQDSARTTPATADGDPVGAWDDASGGARNFIQATAAARPILRLSLVNGRPAVRFDGTDDLLAGTTLTNFIINTAYTLFTVFRPLATPQSHATSYQNDAVVADAGAFWGQYFKAGPNLIAFNWDGAEDQVSRPITTTDFHLAEQRHEAGTLYLKAGGTETSVASGNTQTLTGVVRLGRGYTGATGAPFAEVEIAAVVLYNVALSSGDRAAVADYLTARYFTAAAAGHVLGSSIVYPDMGRIG